MTILDQLYRIYMVEEWWHSTRLSRIDFDRYTQKLIDTGNLFYVCDGERVVGYTEVWRINFEQFGKLLCGLHIDASDNDVQTGNLGYVANVWIDKDYDVYKELRQKYFEFTKGVDFHCGQAKRKSAYMIKVFDAKKLKGERYG